MATKKTQQIFRSMKSVLSSVYGLEVGMDSGCILVIVSPQMCLSCTEEGKINGRPSLITTHLPGLLGESWWTMVTDLEIGRRENQVMIAIHASLHMYIRTYVGS